MVCRPMRVAVLTITVTFSLSGAAGYDAAFAFLGQAMFQMQLSDTQLAAPSGLAATPASMNQINLSWVDNSATESGFTLERSFDGSTAWTTIATLATDSVTYSDASLNAGKIYYYRIKAFDATRTSNYSDTASATTTSPCGGGYSTLSGADRYYTYGVGSALCDSTGNSWYRFSGSAGTMMPTSSPGENRCGTHAPGWLNGTHPSAGTGGAFRTVCFAWNGSTCNWSTTIQVINCGSYYLFQLPTPPVCNLRYCGI